MLSRWKNKAAAVVDPLLASRTQPVAVVVGSPRSGTTWCLRALGDALGAKTLHEPLSPLNGHRWHRLPPDTRLHVATTYLPLGMDDVNAATEAAWRRGCRGVAGSKEGLRARTSLRESLRSGVVVKSVRLDLLLPDWLQAFPAPTLHIRRHPIGVFESLSSKPGLLRGLSHPSFFAEPRPSSADEALRQELLPWMQSEHLEVRFAAFWSLSQRRADQAIQQGLATGVIYEAVCLDPQHFQPFFTAWNLAADLSAIRPLTSSTTDRKRSRVPVAERVYTWRTSVDPAVQARILDVVQTIYPGVMAPWDQSSS